MLSRVAEALYWMARNIERSENNARILSVQLIHMLESSDQQVLDRDWEEVLDICASKEEYYGRYGRLNRDTIIQYLTVSPLNMNSISNCITYARNGAKATRDMLPDDLWHVINGFYLEQKNKENTPIMPQHTQEYLKHVIHTSLAGQGIVESMMTRGVPYTFIKVGKWLERAEKTARILNVICEKSMREKGNSETESYYYWLTALQIVNGYDAYIKEYPPTMDPKNVLPFLIENGNFPRSIRYCMDHVLEAVHNLESGKVSHYSERLFQKLSAIQKELKNTDISGLGMDELMVFLDRFQNHCHEISVLFSETYYLVEPVHSVR
ncbi:alpha-E domain-containing protein [Halobacillus shinanisalinarum]|uniref:Alpha-E domain-containing protein n=1 Tax=Halobacillus shinanisalinarum TaxID=2932258 RepID=A0ABY4H880_9BACI|nr:alpha-E domain-containing protein [Halobacillus shinanisalinarum]UOQ95182.1 alpha-E domain-containing protein [Halobacillus shinanisalinarum]